jgi:hypothetical protein
VSEGNMMEEDDDEPKKNEEKNMNRINNKL